MRAVNSWLLVTLDSCRVDSFVAAAAAVPELWDMLGDGLWPTGIAARACATWTGPAHYSILSGLLPHRSDPTRHPHTAHADALLRHCELLDVPPQHFLPDLWVPTWLRRHGYATHASVSLPVINRASALNRGWTSYQHVSPLHSIDRHCGTALGILDVYRTPWFLLINAGETHYPYRCAGDEPDADDPVLHGLHGVARDLSGGVGVHGAGDRLGDWATPERMARYRARQTAAAAHVLRALVQVVAALPARTRVTLTADHGEAMGEGGWFGHGAVDHPVVLDAPLVDTVRR